MISDTCQVTVLIGVKLTITADQMEVTLSIVTMLAIHILDFNVTQWL